MNGITLLSGMAAVGLLFYLVIALINPEDL